MAPDPDPIVAAEAYEALHVPALFGTWVEPVLDAAEVGPGDRVLDVGCGTGVLGRGARSRVGESGAVAGVDPDAGMIGLARRIEPGVEWAEGTAEELPYPDGAFDAVVSQFGLMFFRDRRRALDEMLRVLARDGRIAIAVWDAVERIRPYALVVRLLQEEAGEAAADALRAPFVLGDRDRVEELVREAGGAEVTATTRVAGARFPDVRTMVGAELRGWLPLMGVHLEEDRIEAILAAAEDVLSDYVTGDGAVVFDTQAHIVSAARP
jgi:SAM-dependent methyltransferase